jgi:hypothetical protein
LRVISGRDGADLMSLTIPAGDRWVANRIANIGDVDGDGHTDLLVSFAVLTAGSEASVWSGHDGHRFVRSERRLGVRDR